MRREVPGVNDLLHFCTWPSVMAASVDLNTAVNGTVASFESVSFPLKTRDTLQYFDCGDVLVTGR